MVIQTFDSINKALDLVVNGDHRLPPHRVAPSSEQH